jgi:hypothetical protein
MISTRTGAGIAQRYSAGLQDGSSEVRVPVGAGNFALHHRVQKGSGAHPASYTMGNKSSFLGVKRPVCEAHHSSPYSAEVKELVELYLHSPNIPSWRGTQLKARGQTFPQEHHPNFRHKTVLSATVTKQLSYHLFMKPGNHEGYGRMNMLHIFCSFDVIIIQHGAEYYLKS